MTSRSRLKLENLAHIQSTRKSHLVDILQTALEKYFMDKKCMTLSRDFYSDFVWILRLPTNSMPIKTALKQTSVSWRELKQQRTEAVVCFIISQFNWTAWKIVKSLDLVASQFGLWWSNWNLKMNIWQRPFDSSTIMMRKTHSINIPIVTIWCSTIQMGKDGRVNFPICW